MFCTHWVFLSLVFHVPTLGIFFIFHFSIIIIFFDFFFLGGGGIIGGRLSATSGFTRALAYTV